MKAECWQQIEEILQAALDLAPGVARSRLIAERCAGDDRLRAEIERLLRAQGEAENFMESTIWVDDSLLAEALADDREKRQSNEYFSKSLIGKKIGAFELREEIGRGGMGAVYLAERVDGGFRQKAAVKLMRPGINTAMMSARFRRERQILADLEHPFIARLIDGGTTDDDVPFFIMEFIDGEPLYRFCKARKLELTQRLQLFLLICEAVAAAHETGVVHRDLKPSNILVKPNGTPKLLDFGIAKILNAEDLSQTFELTAAELRLMTPEYASPEQTGDGQITPVSDIYSLGVILYELVSGRRPYVFQNRAAHEIQSVIREQQPLPPSFGSDGDQQIFDFNSVERLADGDFFDDSSVRDPRSELDRIVLKALRKNAGERYQSVAEFSADIQRFLAHQPVLAEPLVNIGKNTAEFSDKQSIVKKTYQTGQNAPEKTIAVLPLRAIRAAANDGTDDFLGICLADALITKLSSVQRFIVRPTSSILRYNERSFDPFLAGSELNVEFLVDGSVRQIGDKIRVNIQLLQVEQNSTVWARVFDEIFTDVLELEDAISARVAESLVPKLTGEERHELEKRGTNKPEAQQAFLRGRFYWNQMTAEGFARSIEFYNLAISHDPMFAAAYAGIAEYYSWMAVYGLLKPVESLAKAREAAERAVLLDDKLAEAHAAHGLALLTHETQWTLAGNRFRRALELNEHSASAHVLYACQLAMEARFDEAITQARRARALDPLNPFNRYILAWCFYQARDYAQSIAENQRLIADEPRYGSGYFTLSWSLRRAGRYDEAVAAAEKADELTGGIPMIKASLAAAYAEAGDVESARKILTQLNTEAERQFITPLHLALAHLALGETGEAYRLLEAAVDERDPWTVWFGTEPLYDQIRTETRFQKLLERANSPFAAETRF